MSTSFDPWGDYRTEAETLTIGQIEDAWESLPRPRDLRAFADTLLASGEIGIGEHGEIIRGEIVEEDPYADLSTEEFAATKADMEEHDE